MSDFDRHMTSMDTTLGTSVQGEKWGDRTALQPMKAPEIPLALSRLQDEVGSIEEAFESLNSQLAPVLSHEGPADPRKDPSDSPQSVVANTIEEMNDRLAQLRRNIIDTRNRLEI